jgi:hypothetical protein
MSFPRITNPLTILKRRRQTQAEKRKIQEQEKLIEALRRPENEPRRRPAMKFATNRKIK